MPIHLFKPKSYGDQGNDAYYKRMFERQQRQTERRLKHKKARPLPEAPQDAVKRVSYADHQHNILARVAPYRSRITDGFFYKLDVTIRPTALLLATPIIQREVERIVEDPNGEFQNYIVDNQGDAMDISNVPEWAVFLNSGDEELNWDDVIAEANTQGEQDHSLAEKYISALNKFTRIVAMVEGNHDGAYIGNALNHMHPANFLRVMLEAIQYQLRVCAQKVRVYERKLSQSLDEATRTKFANKKAKFEVAIQDLNHRKDHIETKLADLPGTKLEQTERKELNSTWLKDFFFSKLQNTHLSNEKEVLQHKLKLIEARLARSVNVNVKTALSRRQDQILTRLARIDETLSANREKMVPYYKHQDKEFLEKKLLPGWLTTVLLDLIYAVPWGNDLFEKEGYVAKTDGGEKNIVDKLKYLELYLSARYNEFKIDGESLKPLASPLEYFDEDTGYYRTDTSAFSNINDVLPVNIEKNFNNLWKKVRDGEYICLLTFPYREKGNANMRSIFVQAFDRGLDANGRRQYDFFLDGMDNTEELMPTAYFGVLSTWQRRVCELFANYQNLQSQKRRENGNWFNLFCHFSIAKCISMKYWQKSGWRDFLRRADVVPFFNAAHLHRRGLFNATKQFYGPQLNFLLPKNKRRYAADFISPSVTDNFAFATTEMWEDTENKKLHVNARYRSVMPKDRTFDEDVTKAVDELKDWYRAKRYREASEMPHDAFTSVYEVFFTNQERMLAKDAIPVLLFQYQEQLIYLDKVLEFVKKDIGEYSEPKVQAARAQESVQRKKLEETLRKAHLTVNLNAVASSWNAIQKAKEDHSITREQASAIEKAWVSWRKVKMEIWRLSYPRRLELCINGMKNHLDKWLNGDPDAELPEDRLGYLKAKEHAKTLPPALEIKELIKYDDLMDTSSTEEIRHLLAELPRTDENHKAFDFLLLLGYRSQEQELLPDNFLEVWIKKFRKKVPDETHFEFNVFQ